MNDQPSHGSLLRLALVLAALLASVAAIALPAGARPATGTSAEPARAATGAPTLAYVRSDHIWTCGTDRSDITQLTKGTSQDSIPVWSPDGDTVAFVRSGKSGLNASVRTVAATGGTPQILYKSAIPKAIFVAITGLAYTPDGTQLTLAESWATDTPGDVGRCRVVSYDLATGDTRVLLSRNGGFGRIIGADWQIAWSPDGTTLAIAQSGQDSEGGQTWLFTPAGGGLRRLGKNQASFADWAPSGAALLLSTFTQESSKIQGCSLAGKLQKPIATGGGWQGGSVQDARLSWDGSTVLYTYTPKSVAAEVWLMAADGSGKRRVTTGAQPAWR